MENESEILFREMAGTAGNLGIITLNRPKALNALTHRMCIQLDAILRMWSINPQIKAVVIYGMGDRAFCAGGDIRDLYEKGNVGDYVATTAFFQDEYRLNQLIYSYPKPYISLLDGTTMGGGVGVSQHGSHKIVTERFLFAMPETGIGFFPDVGGTYFLPRCPGEIGIYLGLSGERLNAAEAIYANIADHFIFSSHLQELVNTIANTKFGSDPFETVSHLCESKSCSPEPPKLEIYREYIDTCFQLDSIEDIMISLQQSNKQWHRETFATLLKKSPTSLKVTLKALRTGKTMDFDACLRMEFRLALHFMQSHDFYEGVRAVLIDKDHKPYWKPDRLNEVTEEVINSFFAPLESGDLLFTLSS